ncbi:MAG: adenosylmethionine decarboxylase [Candidatus Aenigmarchaeota archaeon]|nr:adenosylmethionine decarboxylase [Candidatus Aenigmarchaeota archaeon]
MNQKNVPLAGKRSRLDVQNAYGLHLTVDGYGCDKAKLGNMNLVFRVLDKLPEIIGMHKITTPYVMPYDGDKKPEDWGVSGFVMIAESHISVHTYPEKGYLTADVYSCNHFDSDKAVEFLTKAFGISELERNEVIRGLNFPKSG